MQGGTNEKPYWKFPLMSQSITFIKNLFQRDRAFINTRIGEISAINNFGKMNQASLHNRLLTPNLAIALNFKWTLLMPSAQPSKSSSITLVEDVSKTWMQLNGKNEVYAMKNKSQECQWGHLCWQPPSHIIFTDRSTKFKFGDERFHDITKGTHRTTSRLSTWIIHWKTTTSRCLLPDMVRTERTSLKKSSLVAKTRVFKKSSCKVKMR